MARGLSAVVCATLLCSAVAPPVAEARKSDDFDYRWEQVWSASVRMVRVDLRFPITEQDPSIGYVLFEYRERGRSYPGSVELVRVTEGRREKVRVVVQIPSMPSYIEQMMLDRLARKLREEFGEPPPPPREPEPPATPPADEGQGDDDPESGAQSRD